MTLEQQRIDTANLKYLLQKTGFAHYTSEPTSAPELMVLTSTKQSYKNTPMFWDGKILRWAVDGELCTAHVREDGRVEVRHYQAPRRYTVSAHDRLLYGAACGGDDSLWESGGWPEWPGLQFSEYREAPERACRVEWTGEHYSHCIAGLEIEDSILAVYYGQCVRMRPVVGWNQPDRYAHPYKGGIFS